MSSSLKLLSKILQDPVNYTEAKRIGVSDTTFIGLEEQLVWGIVEDYYKRHGNVPPLEYIQQAVPSFTVQDVGSRAVSELVERLRNENIDISLANLLEDIENLRTKGKYKESITRLQKGLAEVTINQSRVPDFLGSSNAKKIMEYYQDIVEGGFFRGIRWPWEPLNQHAGGIQPGTFTVLYGRPKSTKTFRLLEMLVTAQEHDKKVLLVSCEMDEDLLLYRIACIRAKIDYTKFKKGLLSDEEFKRLSLVVEELEDSQADKDFVITKLVGDREGKTVSAMRAKIDEHGPDLVMVDSAYKMVDEQTGKRDATPQTIRNICYDIQNVATTTKLPHVITTQANKAGTKARLGSTEDVAFGDSFVMDCDLLIRIVNDTKLGRAVFMINAAREIVLDGFSTGNRCCDGMGPVKGPDGQDDWAIPSAYLPKEDQESSDGPKGNTKRFR